MDLHPSIETYFDADARGARDRLVAAFSPEATVLDEGHTYSGRTAIGAWWAETKARYRTTLRLLQVSHAGDATAVRALATGDFPGSPATLTFLFWLQDNQIKALEIGA